MNHLYIMRLYIVMLLFGLCSCQPGGGPTALSLGTELANDSPLLLFSGWSNSEKTHRWSLGKSSSINFNLNARDLQANKLTLAGNSFGEQRLVLILNGKKIYSGSLSGAPQELVIDIPVNGFKDGTNTLSFETPDARAPGAGDTRVLGFSLKSFKLE
jgi:hypothetical protein